MLIVTLALVSDSEPNEYNNIPVDYGEFQDGSFRNISFQVIFLLI